MYLPVRETARAAPRSVKAQSNFFELAFLLWTYNVELSLQNQLLNNNFVWKLEFKNIAIRCARVDTVFVPVLSSDPAYVVYEWKSA